MKFTNLILAVLFSLALILGPALPATASADAAASACADCDCGMMECCLAATSDHAQPEPAVPTQTTARPDGQALPVVFQFCLIAPDLDLPQPAFAELSPRLHIALPLYLRHCSYLI